MEHKSDKEKNGVASRTTSNGRTKRDSVSDAITQASEDATQFRRKPSFPNLVTLIKTVDWVIEGTLKRTLAVVFGDDKKRQHSRKFESMCKELKLQADRFQFHMESRHERAIHELRDARNSIIHHDQEDWVPDEKRLIEVCLECWELVEHFAFQPGVLRIEGAELHDTEDNVQITKGELLQAQKGTTAEPDIPSLSPDHAAVMSGRRDDDAGAWVRVWKDMPEQTTQDARDEIYIRVLQDLASVKDVVKGHSGFPVDFDISQEKFSFTVNRRDAAPRGGDAVIYSARVSCHGKSKVLMLDKFHHFANKEADGVDRSIPIHIKAGKDGGGFSLEIYGQPVSLDQVSEQVLSELLF